MGFNSGFKGLKILPKVGI